MKVQKVITLDIEIIERLKKEANASGLINNILLDFYNDNKTEEQILEETRKKIKAKEIELLKEKEFAKKLSKRNEEGIKKYNKTHGTK